MNLLISLIIVATAFIVAYNEKNNVREIICPHTTNIKLFECIYFSIVGVIAAILMKAFWI